MIGSISSALSGLQAAQTRLDATAQNLANANTDGYKSLEVTAREGAARGVETTVTRTNTPGPQVAETLGGIETLVEKSNVDLSQEIPQLVTAKPLYQANLKAIQAQNEMLGSLLDLLK